MELAISQVLVMVNVALFSSNVKLIFGFQVTQHWQQADPFMTEWEGESGRQTLHSITLSPSLCYLWAVSSSGFVLIRWVSLNVVLLHRLIILSFWIPLCLPVFIPVYSQFCRHSELWLEVTRHQTVHPSGLQINIWRGCWLFWHGEETHISVTSCSLICVCCFCLLALCFCASPSNSFPPPFLSSTHS